MLFGISDAKHSEIYFRVAEEVYSKSLAEILKSGSLSAEKKEALQSLATQLAIPDDIRNRVFQAEVKHLISDRIDAVLSDRKLSPDEEEELKRLAHSLGASVSYSEAKLGELEECRLRWRIMHSQLPRLDVSLTLQGSECCHYESHAEWHEHRTVTTRFGYSGPSLRIRIAKGLYWNLGQMGVKRHQEEILKKIDEGRLYLTNKRVIFVGQTRSTSIKLAEIINMQPFSDGVEIQKSRGRSPTFVTGASAEFPVMILARLISELR